MYLDYFGLKEIPFSIAPDPRYLYMSERHREALAHLLYGVSGQGGFVVLTGEVGTGKTTICRCFLNQVPKNTDVAFIINPKLSARELMATICDELSIAYPESASIKVLNDLINHYLLAAHADKRHTVLIIDEAQNLRVDVLEQLRLLTNLETSEKKLLQIILLGQPELRELLAQNELRQLSQRVTARYHLHELSKMEVGAYVQCRLAVAGRRGRIFTQKAINSLYQLSEGVPRLINLISDRALLGAYASQSEMVEADHVKNAFNEIKGERIKTPLLKNRVFQISSASVGVFFLFILAFFVFEALDTSHDMITDHALEQPIVTLSVQRDQNVSEPNSSDELNIDSNADIHNSGASVQHSAVPADDLLVDSKPQSKRGAPYLDQITGLAATAEGKFLAYQLLMQRWGVEYLKEPFVLACEFAEMYGLRCLHNSGNWRSLLKLNRPAVLTLTNEYGQPLYFSLLAIEGQDALVGHEGDLYWVGMDELDRYWLGEYTVFWKLPPYQSRVVAPGQQEKEVWLLDSLSRLGRAYKKEGEPLEQKIQRFQQSSGLVPDGIPGTMTLIHINKRLCLDCPKLLGGM